MHALFHFQNLDTSGKKNKKASFFLFIENLFLLEKNRLAVFFKLKKFKIVLDLLKVKHFETESLSF